MKNNFSVTLALVFSLFLSIAATGQGVEFKDPAGDGNGPGTYKYPSDPVYKKGSFDLLGFTMKPNGARYDIAVQLDSVLEDPWKYGGGFSTQMVFIFIDTDRKKGSGSIEGLPGLNVRFAAEDAWDKCIILSPLMSSRVRSEVSKKAAGFASAIIVPSRTRAAGSSITGSVYASDLGAGDPAAWGYQVVVQSSEAFPADNDLLTRRVNEYEGQHRFGGGHDGNCDPHVIDLLAGKGAGIASEIGLQHKMLAFQCAADGTSKKMATLTMVRK